jgi:hypothetical protein
MIELFKQWLSTNIPEYVTHKVETSDHYDAISINIDNEDTQKASALLTQIYNKQTIMRYCGAAVPIS